jgi:hypothetical protein
VIIRTRDLKGRDLNEVESLLFAFGEHMLIGEWTEQRECWKGMMHIARKTGLRPHQMTDEELAQAVRGELNVVFMTIWAELCFCGDEPRMKLTSKWREAENVDVFRDTDFALSDPQCFPKIGEWMKRVKD